MTVAEIQHLAALSRITMTDAEAEAFSVEFDAILHYVEQVKAVSADTAAAPVVGALANVMRADASSHEPEAYTEALLEAVPLREGRYVRVKKILGTSDEG